MDPYPGLSSEYPTEFWKSSFVE